MNDGTESRPAGSPPEDQRPAEQSPQAGQAPTGQRADLDAAETRVRELIEELDATNRGVVALHTELQEARASEARAWAEHELLSERDRIARDLHDRVIQRVFGAGLTLQGIAGLIGDPHAAARIRNVISELDGTVQDLRTAIYGLQPAPYHASSLRAQLSDLVSHARDTLGFTPSITLEGPIDAVVPDHIATDLLDVAREALSNIARHARATSAEIVLIATDELLLQVDDNGRGLGHPARVSGIANMRDRAHAHGGTFHAGGEPGSGTRLQWRVPLPPTDAPSPDP